MANWKLSDSIEYNGQQLTINELDLIGLIEFKEHFQYGKYIYLAELKGTDRSFQINKAAYLSKVGKITELTKNPVVNGIEITAKAINDYNKRNFPECFNDSYNKSKGLTTWEQIKMLQKIDKNRFYDLTLDQVRRYIEKIAQ